jgi:Tol biopolymer transport system component
MSVNDVDRLLATWLASDAPMREPDDLLDQVLARTRRTRRRPGWLIPERWLSMQLAMRWQSMPRVTPILVVLALLIALVAVVVMSGGRRLPAPYGPAGNGLVAYLSGSQLVIGASDGSSRRAITAATAMAGEPVFSPLGRKIAYKLFASMESTHLAQVQVADVASGTSVLVQDWVVEPSTPSWSPDERWLVYSTATGLQFPGRMFVAPADGSAPPRPVGPTDHFTAVAQPVFSPDGRRIAFVHWGVRLARVAVMDADGTDVRDVSGGLAAVGEGMQHGGSALDWNPDGARLLVSAGDSESDRDLYVVDVDRETMVAIASSVVPEYGATWSPQGDRIAYLRGDGFPELVVAGADGSDARVLNAGATITWFTPRWSPDGRFVIASEGGPGNDNTVFLFDATGSAPPRVIEPGPYAVSTDEAPGGSDIVSIQRVAP